MVLINGKKKKNPIITISEKCPLKFKTNKLTDNFDNLPKNFTLFCPILKRLIAMNITPM